MKWLDRLIGRRPLEDERAEDERALSELRDSFDQVQQRTDRLERELRRVNAELGRKQGQT